MASYFPIANLTRQKRLFNPYNERTNALDEVDMSTPGADALSSHLGTIPNREDYRLGTKDKILNAIVGGLTGFTSGAGKALDVTQENRDRPYREALESWGMKAKGLEGSADIESRRINSRIRQAESENRYFQAVDELDRRVQEDADESFNRQETRNETIRRNNLLDENADLTRKQTETYQGRMAGAAEKRAEAAVINANRPRTGNTPKPTPMYKNPSDAQSTALGMILEEEPGFDQYIDPETRSLMRDKNGDLAKRVNGQIVPLTNDDRFELKRIGAKLKMKQEELLRQTRSYDTGENDILEDEDEYE